MLNNHQLYLTAEGGLLMGKTLLGLVESIQKNSISLIPKIGQLASAFSKGPAYFLSSVSNQPILEDDDQMSELLIQNKLLTRSSDLAISPVDALISTNAFDDSIVHKISILIKDIDITSDTGNTKDMILHLVSKLKDKFSSAESEDIPQPLGSITILLMLLDNRGMLNPLSLFSHASGSLVDKITGRYEYDSKVLSQLITQYELTPLVEKSKKKRELEQSLKEDQLNYSKQLVAFAPIFHNSQSSAAMTRSVLTSKKPNDYYSSVRNDMFLKFTLEILELF